MKFSYKDKLEKNFKFIFIPLFPGVLFTLPSVNASDFQLWLETNTNFPVKPCWNLHMEFEARFRNNASQAHFYFIEANLIRDLAYGWQLSPGYRQVYRRDEDEKWRLDAIPHFAIFKNFETCGYEVFSRSRGEYRFLEETWVFRQRVICNFPWEFTPMHLRVSTHGEIFFKTGVGLSQIRLFAGIVNNLLRTGYMYRRVYRGEEWKNDNVLFISYWWNF